VGFLDNDSSKMNGCVYQGSINNLATILKERTVDEVVIALPNTQNEQIQQCIETCDYYGTKARILPDFYQYTSSTIQVNNIGLMPVISVSVIAAGQDGE
jgi:putative colanic acid biosynthesis UDP-glucose lipid carrier transferase